jgi:hypothetical protein
MLREEQYIKIAETFGTGVGIAEWSGDFYPHYTNVGKIPDEYKVIILTNLMIKENIYQKAHREIYRLKKKIGKRRIKESTIYEKALNNLMEQNEIHPLI